MTSSSISLSSADFSLGSLARLGSASLRLRYTSDPTAFDEAAVADALNPENYAVAGVEFRTVVAVVAVPGDPSGFDIYLDGALAPGEWTLTVSNVLSEDGNPLVGDSAIAVTIADTEPTASVTDGAESAEEDVAVFLASLLGPGMTGDNWGYLTEALAVGDESVAELARDVASQLFLGSAEGRYLDVLAGDRGVTRSDSLGMSDADFRELAVSLYSEQLTPYALWRVLEVFYGPQATRASLTSLDGPWAFVDGDDLVLHVDGETVAMRFDTDDFGSVGQVTAGEVAIVVNRRLRAYGVDAWAFAEQNPVTGGSRLVIVSGRLGYSGRLWVAGGRTQRLLQFPTMLDLAFPAATILTVTQDGRRMSVSADLADADFLALRAGDRMSLRVQGLEDVNQGEFEVLDVAVEWTGSEYATTIVVDNQFAVADSAEVLKDTEVLFWRPDLGAPTLTASLSSARQAENSFVLPPTTEVVDRTPANAGYLPETTQFDVDTARLRFDGLVALTTTTDAGLSVGDRVLLDDMVVVDEANPGVIELGTTTESRVDHLTSVSTVIAPTVFTPPDDARWATAACVLGDGILVSGGRVDATTDATQDFLVRLEVDDELEGRKRYTYDFTAIDSGVTRSTHAVVSLSGRLGSVAMRIGGLVAGATATDHCDLVDAQGNVSGDFNGGTMPACWGQVAVRLLDTQGDEVVIVSGGQIDGTTATDFTTRITTDTGYPVVSAGPTDNQARIRHAGCALSSSMAIWCGGATNVVAPEAIPETFGVDADGDPLDIGGSVGKLAIARYDHAMVNIGDGRALAIGGWGRNPSQETVDRAVHEVEMFDLATRRWTPAGRLKVARVKPSVLVIDDEVWVIGGATAPIEEPHDIISSIEVYSMTTGRWTLLPWLTGFVPPPWTSGAVFPGTDVAYVYGGTADGGVNGESQGYLYVPGAPGMASRRALNGELEVVEVVGAGEYLLQGQAGGFLSMSGGTLTVVAAAENATPGPYLWSPDEGVALGAVQGETTESIGAGAGRASVQLVDASEFPDAEGWVVFDLGLKTQEGPVRYIGRPDSTTLTLDHRHRFVFDHPSGATVDLLTQKEPYAPSDAAGSTYLTDVSAGRRASIDALRRVTATGPEFNVDVQWPGDRGLGGAGLPTSGAQKLSDIIRIWGGDDIEDEVVAAQEEDDL